MGKPSAREPDKSTSALTVAEQIFLYTGLVLGVLLSRAVTDFDPTKPAVLNFTLGTIVVALIVALVIVPYAYAQLRMNAVAPFIVRLALFVQHGVFWETLVRGANKGMSL